MAFSNSDYTHYITCLMGWDNMATAKTVILALYVSGVILNYLWLPRAFPISMVSHNLRRIITALLWPVLLAIAFLL